MKLKKSRILSFRVLFLVAVACFMMQGWSQVMVIRHTDGSEQRMFAGNIDKISFEAQPYVTEGIYTSLDVEAHIGNFILRFNAPDLPEISLDVLTDRTSYLPEGTYPVVNTDSLPNVINGKFLNTTYVKTEKGPQAVTGGRMTVTAIDTVYTFMLELELANRDIIVGQYTGKAKEASRYVEIQMDKGVERNSQNESIDEKEIILTREDATAEACITLWCYPIELGGPYSGTYYPAEEPGVGYYSIQNSRVELYFPHQTLPLIGNVEWEGEDDIYKVECRAIAPDGRIYIITYQGEIEDQEENPDDYEDYRRPKSQQPSEPEFDYYLNVNCTNGDIMTLPFEQQPVIIFEDDRLSLKADGKKLLSEVEFSKVHSFDITRHRHNSIKEIKTDRQLEIKFAGDEIQFKGLRPGELIRVCSLSGIELMRMQATPEGDARLARHELSGDIALIWLADRNYSLKIRK